MVKYVSGLATCHRKQRELECKVATDSIIGMFHDEVQEFMAEFTGQQGHSEPPSARTASTDQQTCPRFFHRLQKLCQRNEIKRSVTSCLTSFDRTSSYKAEAVTPAQSGCAWYAVPQRPWSIATTCHSQANITVSLVRRSSLSREQNCKFQVSNSSCIMAFCMWIACAAKQQLDILFVAFVLFETWTLQL